MTGPVVLALDTAGSACSVAVAAGDCLRSAERIEGLHGQAEALLPLVDRAVRNAGLTPAALNFVVATVGPGSFTGIRVGLAGARGIALATSARLIGVTSFDAVATAATWQGSDRDRCRLIALESRREDLYIQLFDPLCNPLGEPAAIMPVKLAGAVNAAIGAAPLLVAGDAAHRAALALSERPDTNALEGSSPGAIGAWGAALRIMRTGKWSDSAQPLYLRPPNVTLTNGRRRPGRDRA
jgi:tRNA threonylcarbamoyladenosine biosynthesis protein TsaB